MALSLEPASNHIPHLTWRVVSADSRQYRDGIIRTPTNKHLGDVSKEELQEYVSALMCDYHYDAPFVLTSVTGSLLWALKWARGLLSHRYREVQLLLVNSWAIRKDRIYPAAFLVEPPEVAHLSLRVRDAMDHEYFVFGDIPDDAILGSLNIDIHFVQGSEINKLLPGFGDGYKKDIDSFNRFTFDHRAPSSKDANCPANVTEADIEAASSTASKILAIPDRVDADLHLQIAMMLLSLRRREWNDEVWTKIQHAFKGVCISGDYLYRNSKLPNDRIKLLEDVQEWVRGMGLMGTKCILAQRASYGYA